MNTLMFQNGTAVSGGHALTARASAIESAADREPFPGRAVLADGHERSLASQGWASMAGFNHDSL